MKERCEGEGREGEGRRLLSRSDCLFRPIREMRKGRNGRGCGVSGRLKLKQKPHHLPTLVLFTREMWDAPSSDASVGGEYDKIALPF